MKTIFSLAACCLATAMSFAQNVGIGTNSPTEARLVVTGGAGGSQALFGKGQSAISIETGPAALNFNNYYAAAGRTLLANGYTGKFVYENTNGLLSYYSSTSSGTAGALVPVMNILATISKEGYFGLNTNTGMGLITTRGTVGAVAALFGDATTGVAIENNFPGIGLNTYYNGTRKYIATGYGGLISLNPNNGDFAIYSAASSGVINATASLPTRFIINKDGNIGIQGNAAPAAPLSFSNTIGNKIALWGSADVAHYGIGIQGSQLQLYTDQSISDIVFGYGKSGVAPDFTERVRFKGNGNVGIGVSDPGFRVDMLGRMRLRYEGGNSPGIWFNKPDNTQGSFIGTYDGTNLGIWGPGAVGSWKFLFDGNDGTMRIGTTQKATGYLLNVGGKIMAEEVRVQLQAAWPDYVFTPGYDKLNLDELDSYINTHGHLPNIPDAGSVSKNGMELGDMQRRMMEKIEELTLYILDLKKEIDQLKKR